MAKGVGTDVIAVHLRLQQATQAYFDNDVEFQHLLLSVGAHPVETLRGGRGAPIAATFMRSGHLQALADCVAASQVVLVIINHDLSPAQIRSIERAVCCRVLDRTGLILDVFALRARTFEGKLQVELAQLEHLSTRLIRGWTHLERQKGGIGLRGPGETQLETDRRLIRARIKTVRRRLEAVRSRRAIERRARAQSTLPTLSLVGYTNAGKSTLFNRLTEASVYEADQLFATLDPTLRRANIPQFGAVICADTVGFIQHLPTALVAAFRATLEEITCAALCLHVVDASHPQHPRHIDDVNVVLTELSAQDQPQLLVYNKVDRMSDHTARLDRDEHGRPRRVWVSATTGEGLPLLWQAIGECLAGLWREYLLTLGPEEGELHARLHALGAVRTEEPTLQGGWQMTVTLPEGVYQAILSPTSDSLLD